MHPAVANLKYKEGQMPRKMMNLLAISIICMGAATAFASPHPTRSIMAKCASTDGGGKCDCSGKCSADETTCTCE
jgi:hypothetical protein